MIDYGSLGIDIQTAMLRHAKEHPNPTTRSRYILWNGQKVWTNYDLSVAMEGRYRIEFLSEPRQLLQGVDVKAEHGAIMLPGGEGVETLRTWHDRRYEDIVEYPYRSTSGQLYVWNVYQRHWPNKRTTDEKWTGNAGFLVEDEGKRGLVFRCSNGSVEVPDFGQLVFRMTFLSSG